MRQFHGTRYAAITPEMVSAEELEVQRTNLSNNSTGSDDDS